MPVYFNPAAGLAANKVPYALGGGRLGDTNLARSSSGMLTLTIPNVPSEIGLNLLASGGSPYALGIGRSDVASSTWTFWADASGLNIRDGASNNAMKWHGGVPPSVSFGTLTNSANGLLQLASHSALTGGISFGTAATGLETIWRAAASSLRTDAKFRAGQFQIAAGPILNLNGAGSLQLIDPAGAGTIYPINATLADDGNFYVVRTVRSTMPAGWGVPTGTLTRSTFDSTTVTLANLAARVAALISDLHESGGKHGLLLA